MVDAVERTHDSVVMRRWPLLFLALAAICPLAAWRLSANPGHFVVVATVARPLTTIIAMAALVAIWRALVPPRDGSRVVPFVALVLLVVVSIGLSQVAQGLGGSYSEATVSQSGIEMRALVSEQGGLPFELGVVVSAELDRGVASRRADVLRVGVDAGPVVVHITSPSTVVVSTCREITTIEVDRETLDVVSSSTVRGEPLANVCPHESS